MLHIQNLQDLCSRYKFVPLSTGHTPCGEEIAGHLDRHFTRLGPPLFLQRNNGGNLNHHEVDALLGDLMVIPINSPVYRTPNNGAIEFTNNIDNVRSLIPTGDHRNPQTCDMRIQK